MLFKVAGFADALRRREAAAAGGAFLAHACSDAACYRQLSGRRSLCLQRGLLRPSNCIALGWLSSLCETKLRLGA